jgi:hypothetical protein
VWIHGGDSGLRISRPGLDLVGVTWALFVIASIVFWTRAGLDIGRQVPLSRPILRIEGRVALALGVVLGLTAFGMVIWSVDLGARSSSFLFGRGSGLFGIPGKPVEILVGIVVVFGTTAAIVGAQRISRAFRLGVAHPRMLSR